MQRVGNLFPTFCSFQNLLIAWRKTRNGSGRTYDAALFFQNLEKELLALHHELNEESWQPRPFRFFEVHDPKSRTIAVSHFRDRVVHHALVNVLEPVFEKTFIADSFATRKGKGVHAAVFRAQHFLRSNAFYYKTDIEKFFDSVSHDILLKIVSRKIKDQRLLQVCEKIISYGNEIQPYGLPIGNRTSQFFANVYLDPLDHFLKERCGLNGYVRYMDDFVLFENDKTRLKTLIGLTEDFLWTKLQLQLKPTATFLNRQQNGLPFLGRRIFPNIIRLKAENLRRISRRIKLREQELMSGILDEQAFLHSMNSYWAMLSFYPELVGLRKSLIQQL